MAGWSEDGPYTDLRDAARGMLGSVRKSRRGRWWAFVVRDMWSGAFPTRDAAMRAVAGMTDLKKGYGL